MPTELNRIKELAGLQQEAAVGLTAQQKQGLDAINAKYGKYIGYGNGGSLPVEAMERAIDPGSTLWADDKEENELKAYMKKMGYKDLSDMESKDEEYVDNVQLPISDAMADDLQKVLGDYNNDSGLAQAAKDYLGSLPESAVQEAPGAEINKSTMPHELDRIKELAGLQQEAAVSLKGKESALKAWYNKYSKYTGGNGDPLPFGLIKAYTESGIISDGYEENELAKAEKALGKKEGDWEDQDWQKVYSMTPITQGMEKDLLTATGSKTIDEELLAKVYDVIEDMYPSYDQVLGKKESTVAEAPATASLSPNQIEAFKKWYATYSKMQSKDVYNYAQGIFKAHMVTGVTNLDGASKQDPRGKAYDDLAKIFPDMDGDIEAIGNALQSQGVDPLDMEAEEDEDNARLRLKAMAGQESISQVDEAIKKATAQLKSFSNFDGLKPYKPKKK